MSEILGNLPYSKEKIIFLSRNDINVPDILRNTLHNFDQFLKKKLWKYPIKAGEFHAQWTLMVTNSSGLLYTKNRCSCGDCVCWEEASNGSKAWTVKHKLCTVIVICCSSYVKQLHCCSAANIVPMTEEVSPPSISKMVKWRIKHI